MYAMIAGAEAAADAAGAVIRPYFRAVPTAEMKGDNSPVTIADQQAEHAMRTLLTARFPDHAIVGEEAGAQGGGRYRWVLDPIDGTRAFITGRPSFVTLIALLDGDVPVLGVIDQPITGERWVGVAGRKTRFRGPFGGAAGCRPCPALADAELSSTSPEIYSAETRPGFDSLMSQVRRTSWGGDGYAYGLLALGQIDVVAEAGLKLWDWAALVPVIEGAGGRITDWQGWPLRPDGPGNALAIGDAALLAPAIAALSKAPATAALSKE
jgi:histidinol phosphatase-like enzyme (inositol monophosphatase family)